MECISKFYKKGGRRKDAFKIKKGMYKKLTKAALIAKSKSQETSSDEEEEEEEEESPSQVKNSKSEEKPVRGKIKKVVKRKKAS